MRNKTMKKGDPWQSSYWNVFAVIGQIFDEADEPSRSASRDRTILRFCRVSIGERRNSWVQTTLKATLFQRAKYKKELKKSIFYMIELIFEKNSVIARTSDYTTICSRFVDISLIKHRAIKWGRTWTTLVFTDTIFLLSLSAAKENECRKRHDGDATPPPPASLEAIIQLVKVSGYVTAHKTNVIMWTNYRW